MPDRAPGWPRRCCTGQRAVGPPPNVPSPTVCRSWSAIRTPLVRPNCGPMCQFTGERSPRSDYGWRWRTATHGRSVVRRAGSSERVAAPAAATPGRRSALVGAGGPAHDDDRNRGTAPGGQADRRTGSPSGPAGARCCRSLSPVSGRDPTRPADDPNGRHHGPADLCRTRDIGRPVGSAVAERVGAGASGGQRFGDRRGRTWAARSGRGGGRRCRPLPPPSDTGRG